MISTSEWIYAAFMASATAATILVVSLFALRLWKDFIAKKCNHLRPQGSLQSHTIVSPEECRIWNWLASTFYDHHVMIKIPVMHFTRPDSDGSAQRGHEPLGGVYCTFTICASDGRVVGCVDVARKGGPSLGSRQLKQSVSSESGKAYCVVNSDHLPTMAEIRTDFLGEDSLAAKNAKNDNRSVNAVRDRLRHVIEGQRHNRVRPLDPLIDTREKKPAHDVNYISFDKDFGMDAWQTNNSFISPLDSRKASRG